jgi:hypothetical protein
VVIDARQMAVLVLFASRLAPGHFDLIAASPPCAVWSNARMMDLGKLRLSTGRPWTRAELDADLAGPQGAQLIDRLRRGYVGALGSSAGPLGSFCLTGGPILGLGGACFVRNVGREGWVNRLLSRRFRIGR